MKKFLTRVIALALVAFLFAAPTTATAASAPVLVNWYDDFRSYALLPDSLVLDRDVSVFLADTYNTDGLWHVSAGHEFKVQVDLKGTFKFEIRRVSTGSSYSIVASADKVGYTYTIPAISSDATYQIVITGLNATTLWGYTGFF